MLNFLSPLVHTTEHCFSVCVLAFMHSLDENSHSHAVDNKNVALGGMGAVQEESVGRMRKKA